MKTLVLALFEDEMVENIFAMIHSAQKTAEEYCIAGNSTKMHDSHYFGMLQREDRFDDIIRKALDISKNIEPTHLSEAVIDQQISRNYRVIEESIYREQKVQRAED